MKNKQGKTITVDIKWQDITPGGTIYDAGCAEQFITGDWRTMRPIFIENQCKQCLLCYPVCPDSSIPLKEKKRSDFDYNHCKGCGICVKVCPFGAIDFVKEEN